MTECDAVREALQGHLDGELAAAERQRVEAHLAACPACRALAGGYRRLFAALGEPPIPDAPPALVGAVMRRVAAERVREQRCQSWVAAAAMLLLGSAAALLLWGRVAEADWLAPSDLSLVAAGRALWEVVADLAGSATAWSGEWLPGVPGGSLVLAAALALLAVNVALAYRWRALAWLNGEPRARII